MTEEGVEGKVESKTGSKRAVKMVPVVVIGRKGGNKIVQYKKADGYPNRVYVPHAEEKDGKVPLYVLEAGVQFGLDWTQFIETQTVTAEQVAGCLRSKGIWTLANLEANPKQARGALGLALGISVAKLRRLVRTHEKQQQKLGGK